MSSQLSGLLLVLFLPLAFPSPSINSPDEAPPRYNSAKVFISARQKEEPPTKATTAAPTKEDILKSLLDDDFTWTNSTDIDDDDRFDNATEVSTSATKKRELLTTQLPKPTEKLSTNRFSRIRTTTPECRKYTTAEKYENLEKAGGRNQRYMADSPDEAAKNFPGLLPEGTPVVGPQTMMSDAVPMMNFAPKGKTANCDASCQELKRKLTNALNTRNTFAFSTDQLSDSGPTEVQEGGDGNTPRLGCVLDRFIPIGNCTKRGEEEVWGYEKLCSACQGVYMLSAACFPTFYNSISCNQKEPGCIFDQFTNSAHGKCVSRTLSLKVMRNRGDEVCEDWQVEYIDVPVACECYLNKNSWLRSN